MDHDALEETLATVHSLLRAEGMNEAAKLIRSYTARAERTGYDNWNGGTEIWEIQIAVPAREFARLGARRTQLEEQITARLKIVLDQETQDWYAAKILPEKERRRDWRAEASGIPRDHRTSIFDGLRLAGVSWKGALDDVEFLSRLYDLRELPSYDTRFNDASGDIWQHCINNNDWPDDWVFSDERFGLSDGPADVFLRFLCERKRSINRVLEDWPRS